MAMLPPLGAVMPHLSPVTSASWSDEGGVYLRSFGPFPGAANLGSGVNPQQLMMFGGIGAAAAMWMQMGQPNHMGHDHGPGMIEVVPNAPN